MNQSRILIAGIGNIFFGDDGFGCEVIRRLLGLSWPAGVRVKDFGIRGLDLAYELIEGDGWDEAILVDAAPRGGSPGTVYLLDLSEHVPMAPQSPTDAHGMDPVKVLALAHSLGGAVPPLRLVGCEPLTLGTDEEPAMGLSDPVAAAVGEAVAMIESLVLGANTKQIVAPNA
jgi:hydrogenase maturation protease